MRRPLVIASVATFLVVATASVSAQLPTLTTHVDSGRMVRMHTATTMTRGRLLGPLRKGDSLLQYCRYPGSPCVGREDSLAVRTMRVSELTRLDVSPGTQWRRGAVIGGVIGAVMGGVFTSFAYGMCEYDCGGNRTPVIALGSLSSAIGFGALGALWGSAFPRWETPR